MKEQISYQQFIDPAFRRAQQIKVKSEAVWVTFLELDGILNISKFARHYLNRSQSWFAQKLYGHTVDGKRRAFTEAEYTAIAASLRELAKRLNEYADCIDNARVE